MRKYINIKTMHLSHNLFFYLSINTDLLWLYTNDCKIDAKGLDQRLLTSAENSNDFKEFAPIFV